MKLTCVQFLIIMYDAGERPKQEHLQEEKQSYTKLSWTKAYYTLFFFYTEWAMHYDSIMTFYFPIKKC